METVETKIKKCLPDGGVYCLYSDGHEEWLDSAGHYHREGGPAIKYSIGDESWYFHGERHRLDGPAQDWQASSLLLAWWYHGEIIDVKSQEEFECYLALKAFW